MRAAVLTVLIGLMLAGCADDQPVVEATTADEPEVLTDPFQVLSFAGEATSRVKWSNGTIPLSQCVMDCDRQTIDLSDIVESGVPMQIHVEAAFTSESPKDLYPGVWIWLRVDSGRILSYETEAEGDQQTIDATILSSGSVEVVMQPRGMYTDPVGSTYILMARATVQSDVVPPGLPISLHMPPNSTVLAHTPDGGAAEVLMWPQSGGAMTFEGSSTMPETMGGDCILMVQEDLGAVISLDADIRFKIMELDITYHDAMENPAAGEETRTYDLPEAAAAVGMYLDAGTGLTESTWTIGLQSRLTDPSGDKILETTWCGAACGLGGSWFVRTPYGDWPAGTYSVTTASTGTFRGQVGLVTLDFVPA